MITRRIIPLTVVALLAIIGLTGCDYGKPALVTTHAQLGASSGPVVRPVCVHTRSGDAIIGNSHNFNVTWDYGYGPSPESMNFYFVRKSDGAYYGQFSPLVAEWEAGRLVTDTTADTSGCSANAVYYG